ncbi:ABC transporter permease [Arcanobacterium phocae]|uniref:ABC transporter permease n=1 Tax=Arcanobacterium phocae TaxID=131112 RepID=UPI001C0EE63C|nr:ABC transporter permease [Arcanobacterium phocae]
MKNNRNKSTRRKTNWLHTIVANQELLLVLLILVILGSVVVKVPGFFSVETLFNILRDSMVNVVFALGVFLVLLTGGIDVSFLAIGITSAYLAVLLMPSQGSVLLAIIPFALATLIGGIMGLINAGVVIGTKVSTLIATLATSAVFMGTLFAFGGGVIINNLPEPLEILRTTNLITAPGAMRGTTRLNILVVMVIAIAFIIWAFLRWTIAGRSVFALGGGVEAAQRAAVPVNLVKTMVAVVAGSLAGIAGMMFVTLAGTADPTAFTGQELNVIAAVVLGGTAITGGKGSVRGTILGVILISLIRTSLVPLGVPAIWQQTMVGIMLLLGVSLQALSTRTKPIRPILEGSSRSGTVDLGTKISEGGQ